MLGETRRRVLESRYDSVFVDNLEDFAALTAGAPFDVVLLCHTLSHAEYVRCLELTKSAWPSAQIISVTSSMEEHQREVGATIAGFAGPRALLRAVQRVLPPTLASFGPV